MRPCSPCALSHSYHPALCATPVPLFATHTPPPTPPSQRDLSAWVASERSGKQGEKPHVLLMRSKLKYQRELGDLDAKLFKR